MSEVGLLGLRATANRLAAGRTSRMNSSRLRETSTLRLDTPVRLPPGRDRLSTMPSATGSPPISNTIGILVVAAFAASATSAPPGATMTASGRPSRSLASSLASAGSRLYWPSAHRYSIGDRAPFGVARVRQAFAEGFQAAGVTLGRFRAEIADDRQGLRAGRGPAQRRPGGSAAGQRDEAATPQATGRVGEGVTHGTQVRLPGHSIA